MPTVIRDLRDRPFCWQDLNLLLRYGWVLEADGLAVYMVLSAFADHERQTSGPGLRRIGKMIRRCREVVINRLALLEALQLITIERAHGFCNVYTLLNIPQNDPWLLEQLAAGRCVVEHSRGTWYFFTHADDAARWSATPTTWSATPTRGGQPHRREPSKGNQPIQPVLPGLLLRKPKPRRKACPGAGHERRGTNQVRGWQYEDDQPQKECHIPTPEEAEEGQRFMEERRKHPGDPGNLNPW